MAQPIRKKIQEEHPNLIKEEDTGIEILIAKQYEQSPILEV